MLHGNIEVNHNVIGTWRAVRKEAVAPNVHRYECKVGYRNIDGYPMQAKFDVEHTYGDGALILASRVLAEAPEHLVKRETTLSPEVIRQYMEVDSRGTI